MLCIRLQEISSDYVAHRTIMLVMFENMIRAQALEEQYLFTSGFGWPEGRIGDGDRRRRGPRIGSPRAHSPKSSYIGTYVPRLYIHTEYGGHAIHIVATLDLDSSYFLLDYFVLAQVVCLICMRSRYICAPGSQPNIIYRAHMHVIAHISAEVQSVFATLIPYLD